MTLHDMAMTRFAQWWRRSVRCGHAYAEGSARTAAPPSGTSSAEVRSTIFWGVVLPALALGLAWPTRGASFVLLAGYLLLFWRTERYYRSAGAGPRPDARLYARSCVLAKFPNAGGLFKYWFRRFTPRTQLRNIEYRPAAVAPPASRTQRQLP